MSKCSMKTEFMNVLFFRTTVKIMEGQHFFFLLSEVSIG